MADQPFLRPDAAGWAAIFADATVHVLGERGLDSWSVGAIARWVRVQPPSILARFNRARVVQLMTSEFAARWVQWATAPGYRSGLPARLPVTAQEVHGVRVWRALAELARSESLAGRDGPQQILAAAEAEEIRRLERQLEFLCGRPATADELSLTAALVHGLRALLIEPDPLVDAATAQHLLRGHIERMKGSLPGPVSP